MTTDHATNEYEQAMEQLDEIICPRCLGTGTVPAMSDNGPDAHEVEVCCDHCDGTGTAGAAYKVLSAYYSKARIELIQLRAFKWRAEQEQKKAAAKPGRPTKPGWYVVLPPDFDGPTVRAFGKDGQWWIPLGKGNGDDGWMTGREYANWVGPIADIDAAQPFLHP